MKKLIGLLVAAVLCVSTPAFAKSGITIKYNGSELSFNSEPILSGEETLVQLRAVAEAMGLHLEVADGKITVSDNSTTAVFAENSNKVVVNGNTITMGASVGVHNDYTFVPVRQIVELFADEMTFDGMTGTVSITKLKSSRDISTGSGRYPFTYFYQSQQDLGLENNGRGYCWVCSYAMLLSDITGEKITPVDVAEVNIARGYGGSFMSGHQTLVSEFDTQLVPALSEDSQYFGGFDIKNKGETIVLAETDEDVRAALREALDNNPKGIIVRYEGYPHSMTAVSYDEENIYFNDPGLKNGEHILFSETCLKNFKLTDISYIQAIRLK